ncbi:MAG TPA: Os1348 family NHLP clan protein [Anaerolineae bacterium]|nr:Os1348 family NHLP clan protein [Anaerolineae bacterium]
MSDLQTLIGKALTDDKFVQNLVDNPEQALKDAGVEPTPEILAALDGVDVDAIKNLASALGDDRAAH